MKSSSVPTFLGSDRALARYLAQPVQRFMHREVSSGIMLLVASVAALIWVNAPFGDTYEQFWEQHLVIEVGSFGLELTLHEFVNDAVMVLFFFVVGLEINREVAVGELRDWRNAAMPALAAFGGMVVPALLYLAFNAGGPGSDGWGIPMATDIAFAMGVVALLGSRVPPSLKLFLLTLAIVDDIGGIIVIAVFYSDGLETGWLALSFSAFVLIAALTRVQVRQTPVYVLIGVVAWYAMFRSGVHATISGVIIGLLAPARPLLDAEHAEVVADELRGLDPSAADVRYVSFKLRESVPVVHRLEDVLHPWVAFLIVPVFALSNAGIALSGDAVSDALSSPVTQGVAIGLLVGKLIGVVGFTWLGTRLGLPLPRDASWSQLLGIGLAAGIGFTVALFIADLGFENQPVLLERAKIGILSASVVSAAAGFLWLRRSSAPDPTDRLDRRVPEVV